MTTPPKIMESWDYAELKGSFRKRIIDLMDSFEVSIDENEFEEMKSYKLDVEKIIAEYYATAEDLAQYGTGLKKTQFLAASEDDIEYAQELLQQAKEKLAALPVR